VQECTRYIWRPVAFPGARCAQPKTSMEGDGWSHVAVVAASSCGTTSRHSMAHLHRSMHCQAFSLLGPRRPALINPLYQRQ
jgi:hypothetical protein